VAAAALTFTMAAVLNAAPQLDQEPNSWVKRSPIAGAPVSPRLGYEGACAWDSMHKVLLRYGGHNQGGGGEQGSEIWTFDPFTAKWTLKEPNMSPPGLCCDQQNVFDPVWGRYVRFPAFSGSHGWQWWREIYLNDSTAWTYDLETNLWRNLRPIPAPQVSPLRCASWDSDAQAIVVFGGEGNQEGTVVYDPYTNTWTRMKPPRQPEFRSGGNMVYDAGQKLHVLFGAQFTDDPHTWAYDVRKNEWRDLKPQAMPPTDRNDAVLAYDLLNRVVVALVKITEGKDEQAKHRLETWTFDTAANKWTKMNPPQEPDSSGDRRRVVNFAPELGLTILENRWDASRESPEQQIWTYCFARPKADPKAPPQPPTDLHVNTTSDGAILTWKPSPSPDVARYEIYRGTGERPWLVNFERIGSADGKQTTYKDTGLKRQTIYYYAVRAAGNDGRLSAESTKTRTQPRIVEDAVVSVVSARQVELTWKSSEGRDVTGYNIERAVVEVWTDDQLKRLKSATLPLAQPSVGALRRIGAFVRINESLIKDTTFTNNVDIKTRQEIAGEPLMERRFRDDQLDASGKPYPYAVLAYRIRAVNSLGVESGPSPFFLTIPSAPQWLFVKEDGARCHLKWAANPEKNLNGYRVYRLDGRWDKDPVSRLRAEPTTDVTFTDETAGKDTRRYHVVAVDALGQEGFPSAPVWFDREWKKYYEPFVGEWHQ
jgi:fibronectin type 3 domain-containing protein